VDECSKDEIGKLGCGGPLALLTSWP